MLGPAVQGDAVLARGGVAGLAHAAVRLPALCLVPGHVARDARVPATASPGDEVSLVHHVALLLVLVPGLGLLQHGPRAASRGLASLGLLQLAGQRGDQGELSAAEM